MNAANATRALAACAVLCAGHAQAELVQQALSVNLLTEHDDNPTLAAGAATGIWRLALTPSYQMSRSAGLDTWNARLGLRLERASDSAVSADRQDPSLSLNWQRATPTGSYGLAAAYEKLSTRVSELQDTGLVSADGSRSSTTLSANWSRALDERNTLSFSGGHSSVAYSGGLNDYATVNAQATLSHVTDERTDPYLSLSTSRYLPETGGASSTSYDMVAGVHLKFSERLEVGARAGLNTTRAQTERSGWQGGIKLDYAQGSRTNLSANLSRSVTASGIGGFVEADQFTGGWRRALSDTDSAGLDLSWRKNRSGALGTTSQISLWASRELAPLWGLRLAYLYKQREGGGLADASAHVLSVTLSYAHPDFSLSRM